MYKTMFLCVRIYKIIREDTSIPGIRMRLKFFSLSVKENGKGWGTEERTFTKTQEREVKAQNTVKYKRAKD